MTFPTIHPHPNKNYLTFGFLFVLILVLVYRFLVLLKFSFIYVDGDQTVMWAGLLDFAAGHFNEPRFYGQPYNSTIGAILAVPLYLGGSNLIAFSVWKTKKIIF